MIENPWSILWIVLAVIAGIVIAAALAVGLGKVHIRIRVRDGANITAHAYWFRFALFEEHEEPDPEKRRDLSRCHNPRLVLRRELRRQERAAKRAYKRALREKKKKLKRRAVVKAEQAHNPKPNLKENLDMIKRLLQHFYDETHGRVKIRVRSFKISVGSDDAAKTALLYGATVQSAASILELINTKFAPLKRHRGDIAVVPNYLSSECHADIDIRCTVSIPRALHIYYSLMEAYEVERHRAYRRARRRLEKKRARAASKSA